MTDTNSHVHRLIARHGPITVAQFMAEALSHPRHGYYMRCDGGEPFGRHGDFITAPEVSQMFGELIGLWCADIWQRMGAPGSVCLVELGPGRGTLITDVLRATERIAGFHAALSLHLVESSPALRERQRISLSQAGCQSPCEWHADLGSVPEGPMILLANEFFDALPIHQFVATPDGWRERMVTCDHQRRSLHFVVAPAPTPALALLPAYLTASPPGTVHEMCPAAIGFAASIGRRLVESGGAALIVDFCDRAAAGANGDSLQAVHRHRRVGVLDRPGEVDLAAHVDFDRLAAAASQPGATIFGPVGQGAFLAALGIGHRAQQLSRQAPTAQAADVRRALERLTAADHMGDLFRVLAITGPGLGQPDGFNAAADVRS